MGWLAAAGACALIRRAGITFLQTLKAPGEHQGHHKIEGRRDDEGVVVKSRCTMPARTQQVVEGQHVDERGVLDQGDGLVAHGRQDAAHHLRQHDAAHGLAIAHAQHLGAFVLAPVNGLDARAEDFSKYAA